MAKIEVKIMDEFCKVFQSDLYGQILVINDENNGYPAVTVQAKPENLGVCKVALEFKNPDESVASDQVDSLFNSVDLSAVENIAKQIFDFSKTVDGVEND